MKCCGGFFRFVNRTKLMLFGSYVGAFFGYRALHDENERNQGKSDNGE